MVRIVIFLTLLFCLHSNLFSNDEIEIIWETDSIGTIGGALLSPNGNDFYHSKDSTIHVRSIKNGKLINIIDIDNYGNDIKTYSISNDGKILVFGGENSDLIIYDLLNDKVLKRLTSKMISLIWFDKTYEEKVRFWNKVIISPNGKFVSGIGSTNSATSIIVFNVETEELLYNDSRYEIRTEENFPNSLKPGTWEYISFSKDSKYFITSIDNYRTGYFDSTYIKSTDSFRTINSITTESTYNSNLLTFEEDIITMFTRDTLIHYDFIMMELKKYHLEGLISPKLYSKNSPLLIYLNRDFEYSIYNYKTKKVVGGIKNYHKNFDKGFFLHQVTNDNQFFLASTESVFFLIKAIWGSIISDIGNENSSSGNVRSDPFKLELSSNLFYPNPSTDYINIEATNQNIIISSMTGTIVKQVTGETTIDISDLPSGVYFVRIGDRIEKLVRYR